VRRVRYVVASSVDGYIAGPKGEFDWIIRDPEIDFGALFAQFDTLLMGRKTYELVARSDHPAMPGARTFVFSRTLRQDDCAGVTVVADRVKETIASLRADAGKDIWLFGGGSLAASLLDAGLVDTVEVAIIPVVLGEGLPLVSPPATRTTLRLTGHRIYPTGIVSLEYAVQKPSVTRLTSH
jgi:dihydrofolate reductase